MTVMKRARGYSIVFDTRASAVTRVRGVDLNAYHGFFHDTLQL